MRLPHSLRGVYPRVKHGAGSEELDPSTQLKVDAEPFGLELTAERQRRSIEGLAMTLFNL